MKTNSKGSSNPVYIVFRLIQFECKNIYAKNSHQEQTGLTLSAGIVGTTAVELVTCPITEK